MRTIKFRGKTLQGKWVYGYYLIREEESPVIETSVPYTIHYIVDYADFNGLNENEILPETVGQFTNLYDVKGKEIYEGDIVNCEDLCFDKYEVKCHQGSFIITPYKTKETLKDPLDESYHIDTFTNDFETSKTKLKIIGNIY